MRVDKQIISTSLMVFATSSSFAAYQGDAVETPLRGPSSVPSQIQSEERPLDTVLESRQADTEHGGFQAFKEHLRKDYDFSFGLDYNMLIQHSSKSLGEKNAAGGALRFFGNWTLTGQESGNPGSIVFKVENRHRLGTDIAPQALGSEIGYVGLTALPFSAADTILTNLYWHQSFYENSFAYVAGIVDVTDYVAVYGLVNPWTDFINLVFSTDPSIPAPDQGPGMALLWTLDEKYYILAGIADANSDPSDPLDSIDSFFDEGESFKHIEVGWFRSWNKRIEDNIHLTLWQVDERTEAGIPDGWGAAFSFSKKTDDNWLSFLRLGYAEDSGALLERSISNGFAYYSADEKVVFGLGLNWGRPNSKIYGKDAKEQYSLEAYYRMQLLDNISLTPDVQIIKNPALNIENDFVWVIGLRVRLFF